MPDGLRETDGSWSRDTAWPWPRSKQAATAWQIQASAEAGKAFTRKGSISAARNVLPMVMAARNLQDGQQAPRIHLEGADEIRVSARSSDASGGWPNGSRATTPRATNERHFRSWVKENGSADRSRR